VTAAAQAKTARGAAATFRPFRRFGLSPNVMAEIVKASFFPDSGGRFIRVQKKFYLY